MPDKILKSEDVEPKRGRRKARAEATEPDMTPEEATTLGVPFGDCPAPDRCADSGRCLGVCPTAQEQGRPQERKR